MPLAHAIRLSCPGNLFSLLRLYIDENFGTLQYHIFKLHLCFQVTIVIFTIAKRGRRITIKDAAVVLLLELELWNLVRTHL